ncbi:c-type cytochrome [Enterovirga sp. CN4-39]|uniref:c-type cytochrome n=1 Tax=Enterovirga sp. CN4-39 TaxID=3400910 RepID=UPI003C062757
MRALLASALVALVAASCDSGTEERPENAATRAVMRPSGTLPEGSVPRPFPGASTERPAVTPGLLARGAEAYAAFCTPCHGPAGRGDGPVVRRGFPAPLPFAKLDEAARSPNRIVDVIRHGHGRMRPMAEQVGNADSWAIAEHVSRLGNAP